MKQYFLICCCCCIVLAGCSRKKTEKEAESLYRQAISAIGSHKYDDAESLVRRSIDIDSDTKRDSALAEDYLLLGNLFEQTGQYDSVSPSMQQAISLAHAIGDKNIERRAKLVLAGFFLELHQYQEAAVNASDAATLSGWLEDWDSAFLANEIVRSARHNMGRYAEEEQILDTLDHINLLWLNRTKEPALFQARFELLQSWNRRDEAGMFYNGWKQTALSRGDTISLIRAYIEYGDMRQSLHQLDSALQAYTQALSMLNFYENDRIRVEVLTSIGNLAMKNGKIDDASRYYNDALDRVRRTNNLPLTEMLSLQAVACQWLAHRSASRDSTTYDLECDKIARAFADSGCSIGRAYAEFLKGRILENRGQLLPALRSYRQALEIYERTAVLSEPGVIPSIIAAFMQEERTGWYDAPLSILCSVGNTTEAFELEEHSNMKNLSDFFLQLPVNSKYTQCNPEIALLQWRRNASAMLQREIAGELEGGTGRNLERLQKLHERDSAWSAVSEVPAEKSQMPEPYRWLFRPGTLTMKQIQDTLRSDDAVVVYIPLAKTVYSIVVRRDTSFIRKSDVDREYLTSLINEYNTLLGSADTGAGTAALHGPLGRINSLSAILYSHFVAPIQSVINPGNRVYVIQTGRIGWFPVHTLRGGGGTFTGKHRLRYLPASAVLLFPSQPVKRSAQIAGLGHPGATGWDVEYELKDIRSFSTDAKMFFDTSATLAHLRMGQYDVLHLCSELTTDPAIPARSQFDLSDGTTIAGIEEISAGEIFSLPSWQTLVFSNISSMPGGMARFVPMAFLANGTTYVLGTMWQGDHKTKKYFGEVFYTGLMNGLNPDDAYDQAVRKLSADKEFASPRLWGLYYFFGK